jgi:hypothetical protein
MTINLDSLTEYREDFGGSITSKIDENGYLRIEGIAARTGVLTYINKDGTIQRELVPQDTLFNNDSLSTLIGSPVTIEHPGIINADNASTYSRGSVPKAIRDEDNLKVSLVITGKDAIDSVSKGKRQLSPGYRAVLDFTPGEYNGQKYDAIQVKRVYNHLAIVQHARGGSECQINLDGLNCAVEVVPNPTTTEEVHKMPTVKLSTGATVEVADASTATALQSEINGLSQRADAADKMIDQAKYDEMQGKHDALQVELDKLKDKASEKMDADELGSFIETVEQAKKLKSDLEIKQDGKYLDATGIMAQALDIKLDGKSPEYIKGRFDSAIELLSSDSVRAQREHKTDSKERTLTGREKFIASQLKRGA